MSENSQPYPTHSSPGFQEVEAGDYSITSKTASLLRRTRPWALFTGIVSILISAFCFQGAIFGLFAGAGRGAIPPIGTALVYGLVGCFALTTGIACVRYGMRIRHYMLHPTAERLDHALGAQLRFWRLIGQFAIAFVSLVAIVVMFSILGAAQH